MRKALRLIAALAICAGGEGCGVELAMADTVTIGYFDPAAGIPGIQVLGTATGASPMVSLQGLPILPTGPTGFGFDSIVAAFIPPGGNAISGGIPGAVNPTLEFTFNDGFSPPQGGTSYLYATFQGTVTGNNPFTMPTIWGVIETPPANPGYTLTTQVLTCNTPNPFCGPFVGGGVVNGQDQFTSQTLHDITLTTILPGQPFKITEVFAFSGGPHPPFAQGDVGGLIMTTLNPTPVPAPIVGTGPAAAMVGAFFLWLACKRRRKDAATA